MYFAPNLHQLNKCTGSCHKKGCDVTYLIRNFNKQSIKNKLYLSQYQETLINSNQKYRICNVTVPLTSSVSTILVKCSAKLCIFLINFINIIFFSSTSFFYKKTFFLLQGHFFLLLFYIIFVSFTGGCNPSNCPPPPPPPKPKPPPEGPQTKPWTRPVRKPNDKIPFIPGPAPPGCIKDIIGHEEVIRCDPRNTGQDGLK